ncbi:hypothetical protein [Flavobacterium lacisediminis]|jgi:hypothetical protein|uniref:Uncharacterized protein n=1 Tax=Flavobacterium lacisediminis TaxID=2989705 RepID=A0ABT3EKX0_9FLAO|nr:hypothetical protein [Flavobacterium lacisediminis]MCW1149220.1 hypothetical protein [Flavobacterium lacisediminis]
MKIFLMIFFSIFSFFAIAQEKGNKTANSKNSSVKNTKNVVVVSKSNDNDSKGANEQMDKKNYPDKVKTSPEEFYIVNDKPVDRVTYLKYLRANKK